MEIITGYTGEPHVTSEQDRDINIGIIGEKSYVMTVGAMMEAEVSTNNEIKIRDGLLIHQGCAASIKKNTYDSLRITNGSQGMKRTDLIVARYERKTEENNKESLRLIVIQGDPAEENPATPSYIEGDIQAGDTVVDMPMYEVKVDGLNIVEIKKVFQTVEGLDQLNKNYVINSGGEPSTGYWEKWSDGTLDMWGTQKAVTTIANNNTVPYYKPPSLIPLPVESTVPVTASLDVATGGMIWAALAAETSESQIAYRLFSGVPYSNVAIEVHWTVKGRWK